MEVTSARQLGEMIVMASASRLVMVTAARAMRSGHRDQSVNRAMAATMIRNHDVLAARV